MKIKYWVGILIFHLTINHAFRLWNHQNNQRNQQWMKSFDQRPKVENIPSSNNKFGSSPISQKDLLRSSLANSKHKESNMVGSTKQSTGIDELLTSLPTTEKYSLLIQSFADKILQTGEKGEKNLLLKIEALYSEMILRKISPEKKAVQNIIDAASSFFIGGDLKGFGASIGLLTSPIFQDLKSPFFNQEVIPRDEREKEVALALGGFLFIFSWIGLQAFDFISPDNYDIYDLFIAIIAVSSLGYDIIYQQAKYIKQSIAGLERLFFRDAARQSFLDASSFVSGYLLGLPSFCYTTGELEGMKMVQQYPESLQAYQQSLLSPNMLQRLQKSFQTYFNSISSDSFSTDAVDRSFSIVQRDQETDISSIEKVKELKSFLEDDLNPFWRDEDRKLALGRVLIWLMFPVAAEMAKYGQALFSNPKRAYKFLDLMKESSNNLKHLEENKSTQEFKKIASFLPESVKDREALLEWAYFEANSLLRQYGDVVDRVDEYLRTGTTTVGECVLLIENEIVR